MSKKLLQAVYSPEEFNKYGSELIDLLTHHLDQTINTHREKSIEWNEPQDEYVFWKKFLESGDFNMIFKEIIAHSTHVHHPKCIGHQVCPPAPLASLAALISSLLNNGMAIYEMGMASSAIERLITEILCKKIGYNAQSGGFLTSGGTLANLTALLAARRNKVKHDVWNEGHKGRLGIMVSEEAHYCVERAAKIMGLGVQGIIKVPVDSNYRMDISQLEKLWRHANKANIHVFAIVGSAPSTATGICDNLQALADFSAKKNLWFHIDAAHGGGAIFAPKYKYTVSAIEYADSVVIDGHKMMMLPTITTALLFKNGDHSHTTFSQKAEYLLSESEEEDWYNMAKRTFECTKNMMSIQWFLMIKMYGEAVFEEYVTTLYDLGHFFGELIKHSRQFELAASPMTNIVCFRYMDTSLDIERLNMINKEVRRQLLEEGEYYIVQTQLNGVHYLRTTIMNPFTRKEDLSALLELIVKKAEKIKRINI